MKHLSSTPRLALERYARLKNIVLSLKDAQPAAEGAAPHLVDYVEKLASGLREHMKRDFTSRLQKSLEQMKWPSKDLHLPEDLVAQWRSDVELLLDLQTPYGLLPCYNYPWRSSDLCIPGNFKGAMSLLNMPALTLRSYFR